MKKLSVFIAIFVVFALILAGCSMGDETVTPVSLPAMADEEKTAADLSAELLEGVKDTIVNSEVAKDSAVAFTVGDNEVKGTVTAVTGESSASGGSAIPAATAENPVKKTIKFKFNANEEISGEPTVTVYTDGSWKMNGETKFKNLENLDGTMKDVPVKYENTRMNQNGEVADGKVFVNSKEIPPGMLTAMKKLRRFFVTLSPMIDKAIKDGTLTAIDITQTKITDVDGSEHSFTMKEMEDPTSDFTKISLALIAANKPTKIETSIKMTRKTKPAASFSYDGNFSHNNTIITTVDSPNDLLNSSIVFTDTINLTADLGGTTIQFVNLKNKGSIKISSSLTEEPAEGEETNEDKMKKRNRWSGVITVDGVKIEINSMKMKVLSSLSEGMGNEEKQGPPTAE